MLEHPVYPPLLAVKSTAVKMRAVRAISRKGSNDDVRESSETLRQTGSDSRITMIKSDLHGDVKSATEMAAPSTRHVGSNNNERS